MGMADFAEKPLKVGTHFLLVTLPSAADSFLSFWSSCFDPFLCLGNCSLYGVEDDDFFPSQEV
jgi:hypothetical protein